MNFFLNLISHNRPFVILTVLVVLSVLSLLTGTETSSVRRGLARVVSFSAYPVLKSEVLISRGASYLYGMFATYDQALEENAQLKENIVRLHTVMAERNELHAENQRLRSQLNFADSAPFLTLQPARIIESFKGALTIDQGGFNGIEESMSVITDKGVVGIVVEVNDFSSIVATLHHMDCKIGAMVQRERLRAYDGVIHASGNDWGYICTMEYIDMKDEVRQGDRVVTSPESVFPSGYPIGEISRVYQTGSLWKTAEIKPYVDPYSLDEVYVIRMAAPNPEMMAGPPRTVGKHSNAKEEPDLRAIQEKLAP